MATRAEKYEGGLWAISVNSADHGELFIPYATKAKRDAAYRKMKSVINAGSQEEGFLVYALKRRGKKWYADSESHL